MHEDSPFQPNIDETIINSYAGDMVRGRIPNKKNDLEAQERCATIRILEQQVKIVTAYATKSYDDESKQSIESMFHFCRAYENMRLVRQYLQEDLLLKSDKEQLLHAGYPFFADCHLFFEAGIFEANCRGIVTFLRTASLSDFLRFGSRRALSEKSECLSADLLNDFRVGKMINTSLVDKLSELGIY